MSQASEVVLCVGDVHLGRRPGRVPADLGRDGVEPRELSPRAAFEAVVRKARELDVRAVLFLGDVVDAEDHYLEAYGTLERGVRELVAAGIAVFAVAGNHDVRALPKLADEVPGFRLLGRGGHWEQALLERDGQAYARLVGWSFPRAKVSASPLADFALAAHTDVPTLGLLHCDLDRNGGNYAPVPRRELEAAGCDGWLLGHVHAPSHDGLRAARPLGYLGSLVGLDPTETGVHGPWLARLGPGRAVKLEQVALAPLVWLALDVDAASIDSPADLDQALTRALRERAELESPRLGEARAVGCRLRLVGRHARHRELAAAALQARLETLRPVFEGRTWFVDRLVDESSAAFDLEELARSSDPPGLVARRVLALQRDDEEGRRLVREARRRMGELVLRKPWVALDAPAPDEAAARAYLLRTAGRTLDELLAGREAPR